jgi:hypothetical protein
MLRFVGRAVLFICLVLAFGGCASSGRAEDAASAKAFAEQLVRRLNSSGADAWVESRGSRTRHVDPSFTALMDDNSRLADGIDLMDADPICQCQDSGGRYQLLSVTADGDEAHVRIYLNHGSYTLVLRRTGVGWRVYDAVDSTGSFRTLLEHHNACMRAHHSPAAVSRCFGAR